MTSQHILRSQLPRQSLRIVELCTNGRVAEAKALVDGGLDLDSLRGLDKLTLFTHCCVWGDFSLVLQLLDLGATLDFRGTNGATPLMQACRSGRLGVVHNLIKLGAQLDASNLGEVKTWVDLAPRSLRCGLLLCLELEVSIPRLVRMATGRFGRFFRAELSKASTSEIKSALQTEHAQSLMTWLKQTLPVHTVLRRLLHYDPHQVKLYPPQMVTGVKWLLKLFGRWQHMSTDVLACIASHIPREWEFDHAACKC